MDRNDDLRVLRESLDTDQAQLLAQIWRRYSDTGEWMPMLDLHRHGAKVVQERLRELGGAIVFRTHDGANSQYVLTLLGVLLTPGCQGLRLLLSRWVSLLVHRYRYEGTVAAVTQAEATSALRISDEEAVLLGRVLAGPGRRFCGSGGLGNDGWTWAPPFDIDVIADQDPDTFVLEEAFREFDRYGRTLSIEGLERHWALSSQQQSQPSPGPFQFVSDQLLREVLERDWGEAERVHQAGGWKSTLLLCGGVLEGILIEALSWNPPAAKAEYRRLYPQRTGSVPKVDRWDLGDLIVTSRRVV